MSSIQITKPDNFIKINIREDVPFKEYCRSLKEFDESLYSKICGKIALYDTESCVVDMALSKIIYVFCSNNSCYTISSNKDMTCMIKRTIYDEKNPNTEDFGTPEDEINDFDKTFHVDDKTILIYTQEKEYAIGIEKHGLFHGSTFYVMPFNSKSHFEKLVNNKEPLLEMAQELIEEIKNIDNIETIVDLSVFDIIPKPEVKKLINEKKD